VHARGRVGTLLAVLGAVLVAGCGRQSTLEPRSRPAHEITTLWWWMLAAAAVVFLGSVGLLGVAWLRRGSEGLPLLGQRKRLNLALVVFFGIVIPISANVAVFVVSNFVVLKQTEAPAADTTRMTIQVIGHQWFWEVRYPGTPAVTANEIHIPTRTRVNVVATTDDVIHSFWVPQLNRKIDMIPGRRNRILLYADQPGRYRGQCAEFCGAQHAHMGLYVFADPPARFRAWLANMGRPRRAPATPAARAGEQVFIANRCSSCHTIRGTAARGQVGPDLTHVATRTTLAALTIPARRRDLAAWVHDPQQIKPGTLMPVVPLNRRDFQSLLAYLESLK
jgi:cytochrome c oxidase subunit II